MLIYSAGRPPLLKLGQQRYTSSQEIPEVKNSKTESMPLSVSIHYSNYPNILSTCYLLRITNNTKHPPSALLSLTFHEKII